MLELTLDGGDSFLESSNDRFVFSRRMLKREARTNLKHHYLMYVVACLFALIISSEFLTSDNLISVRRQVISDAVNAVYEFTGVQDVKRLEKAYNTIDEDDSLYTAAKHTLYSVSFYDKETNEIFGRTRGILNQLINYVVNETIVSNIYSVILQFSVTENAAQIIVTILILMFAAFSWVYVRNVYVAASRRIFLEGRIYKRVPFSRYLFLIRMKRWTRASLVMALKTVFEILGMATVIGFPIVHCGLILVPYIIAENPDVRPFEALKLSWRMMKGNKRKVFALFVSFIGWYLLGFLTLGVANILYANPYFVCCYSEFYAKIRQYSKEKNIPGTEILNDDYLFVRADSNTLLDTYSDVLEEIEKPEDAVEGVEDKRERMF